MREKSQHPHKKRHTQSVFRPHLFFTPQYVNLPSTQMERTIGDIKTRPGGISLGSLKSWARGVRWQIQIMTNSQNPPVSLAKWNCEFPNTAEGEERKFSGSCRCLCPSNCFYCLKGTWSQTTTPPRQQTSSHSLPPLAAVSQTRVHSFQVFCVCF